MKQKLLNSFKLRAFMLVATLCAVFTGQAWADDVYQLYSGEITEGDYLIVDGTAAMNTTISNDRAQFSTVTITEDKIINPDASLVWTIAHGTVQNCTDYYTLYNANDDCFAASTGAKNKIQMASTEITGSHWTISGTSTYEFVNKQNSSNNVNANLRKNGDYGFACYSTSTGKALTLYKKVSSTPDPSLNKSDFVLTNAPVALSFDLYNNAAAQTISYTTSSTGAVTVSTSDYVTTSVNESAKTITVTPVAVTPNAQTITISQAADDTYAAGSQSFTVTIDDSTPLPTYTITLGDNNEELTEATGGAGVTLPTRDAIEDYAFAGWSITNVESETTDAPSIIPAGNYYPTADITLYPVYKMIGEESTPSAFSIGNTGSYAIVSEAQDGKYYALPTNPTVSNGKISAKEITVSEIGGVKFVTPTNADGFAWTIAAATNGYTLSDGSKYIYHSNGGSSGTNLAYGTSTSYSWAFTADGDYIKMAGMSGSTTNNRGLLFSGTTIGGYALSNWGSNGYYKSMILPIAEGATTYYWSAPVAAAVERPTIEVAENPFFFSTTATITCETDGATIMYSYDGETWSDYTAALTITESTTIYAKAFKGNDESNVATVTATKKLATPTVTIAADNITNTNVFEGTAAGSLSASVTYEDTAVEGATVTWSSNNGEVATINASTGEVTLVAAGSVTFTATYAGNSDYSEKTATYEMTVKNIDPNAPGTKNNPYTVAQACAAIDAGTGVTGVYVKGIISQIDSYNSKYYSITYWISEDGTTTNQFEVYSGKGIDGANFSSKDDIVVGASVVVYGDIKNYQGTYELNQNNQLVSYEIPSSTDPAIKLNTSSIAATAEEKDGIITVTYDNITEVVAEVQFCDTEGNDATYDWIDAEINNDNNVEYTIAANDGEARTAYFRVYALDDNSDDVYSVIVTVTQEAYVPDFATLPFEFNGTRSNIENTYGLTQSGLGTDYAASTAPTTQLKFDGTGDNLTLKLNEGKAVLFFDIKGNGFSGSTFTVQTSADGESYSDLATYTALGNAQTETLVLAADVRYVKWVYTEKVSGNVGLGNIKVQKDVTADVAVSSVGFATFSSVLPLDFTDVTEVYAYIAKQNGDRILFTRVQKVPAKTGVLLRSAEGGEANVSVPVLFDDSDDVTGNIFVAALTEISKLASTEGENSNYILSKEGNNVGFYLANDQKVAAGRAYIQVPTAEGVKGFALDFDTETAINGIVNAQSLNGNCYNLSGQRVNRAQKGIFIVNGKKVVK